MFTIGGFFVWSVVARATLFGMKWRMDGSFAGDERSSGRTLEQSVIACFQPTLSPATAAFITFSMQPVFSDCCPSLLERSKNIKARLRDLISTWVQIETLGNVVGTNLLLVFQKQNMMLCCIYEYTFLTDYLCLSFVHKTDITTLQFSVIVWSVTVQGRCMRCCRGIITEFKILDTYQRCLIDRFKFGFYCSLVVYHTSPSISCLDRWQTFWQGKEEIHSTI